MHGLLRTIKDLDFIVDRAASDEADAIMVEIGFERLQRNETFGNYLIGPLRVDLLFTKGERSRRMLERAEVVKLRRGSNKLVRPEDLIGLKLQALANNPARALDRADIQMLIDRFADSMDMDLVQDYFRLFGKEAELDAIFEAIGRGSARDPRGRG